MRWHAHALAAAGVGLCAVMGNTAAAARLLIEPPAGTIIKVPPGGVGAKVEISVWVSLEHATCERDEDYACTAAAAAAAAAATTSITITAENILTGDAITADMKRTGYYMYEYGLVLDEVKYGTQGVRFTVRNASAGTDTETDENSPPIAVKDHHVEIVPHSLTAEQYLPHAHDVNAASDTATAAAVGVYNFSVQLSQLTLPSKRSPRPINIVFVGALKMDGQRTIWLDQLARLPRDRFNLTFACFSCSDEEAPDQIKARHGMAYKLQQLDVPLVTRPGLEMSQEAAEEPGFVDRALRILRSWHRYDRYGLLSLSEDELGFVRAFHACFVDVLRGFDIMVFGNSGGAYSSDRILVEGAMFAGVQRIILELTTANTGLLKSDEVDVLVSPSEFALAKLWYNKNKLPFSGAGGGAAKGRFQMSSLARPSPRKKIVAVIPPGINISSSSIPPAPSAPPLGAATHTDAAAAAYATRRLRIGYVARLDPEKSPGVFLKAALEITRRMVRHHQLFGHAELQQIEFLVIGDGGLRNMVENIGHELLMPGNVSHYLGHVNVSLRFLGWVSRADLLATVLPTLDVLLNPSLTPETFCISNIEAMAVGTPVVTFGVGGQGSYLNARTNGSAGYVVGTSGHDSDLDPTQWPGLLADLAVSVLTMPEAEKSALHQSSRRHAEQYDIVRIVAQSADMYERM